MRLGLSHVLPLLPGRMTACLCWCTPNWHVSGLHLLKTCCPPWEMRFSCLAQAWRSSIHPTAGKDVAGRLGHRQAKDTSKTQAKDGGRGTTDCGAVVALFDRLKRSLHAVQIDRPGRTRGVCSHGSMPQGFAEPSVSNSTRLSLFTRSIVTS